MERKVPLKNHPERLVTMQVNQRGRRETTKLLQRLYTTYNIVHCKLFRPRDFKIQRTH